MAKKPEKELEISQEMLRVAFGIIINLIVMGFSWRCYYNPLSGAGDACSLTHAMGAIGDTMKPFPPSIVVFLGYGFFSARWLFNALFNINGHPIFMRLEENVIICALVGVVLLLPLSVYVAPLLVFLLAWDMYVIIKESSI